MNATTERIERIAEEWFQKHNRSLWPDGLECLKSALTAFAEQTEKDDLWAKDEWLEEDGFVLWWSFPITEPPYLGTPLCSDFPEHVTHWTRIKVPSTGDKSE